MLTAARNETVAFQMVIERTGGKLSNVMVALAELADPNGAKISPENVDLFREWYVHVMNSSKGSYTLGPHWYAGGLLPCLRWNGNLYPHTYVMPFDLPDLLNSVILGLGGWDPAAVEEIKRQGGGPVVLHIRLFDRRKWAEMPRSKLDCLEIASGSWTLCELDFNSLRP